MSKFTAFLRGINVNGIKVSMADLKTCFESIGFAEVKTYLQTGNVTFETKLTQAEVKKLAEAALTKTFNYTAFVLIYEFESLPAVL